MDYYYKYAAQAGLRFPSNRGGLTVEQLFHLPLLGCPGCDLDSIARAVNNQLKDVSEESFVATKPHPQKKGLEAAFEIVKDVIATKQAENTAAQQRAEKIEKKRIILDKLAEKENEALTAGTVDELRKRLAELDD